jgi:hypothetical protein
MITSPLPLTLPSSRVLAVQLLAEPRCAELTCRDAAGHEHVLRCNLWALDRLARTVWPRPVRISFLSEVAAHLGSCSLWKVSDGPSYRLPALAFEVRPTPDGLRYQPILPVDDPLAL